MPWLRMRLVAAIVVALALVAAGCQQSDSAAVQTDRELATPTTPATEAPATTAPATTAPVVEPTATPAPVPTEPAPTPQPEPPEPEPTEPEPTPEPVPTEPAPEPTPVPDPLEAAFALSSLEPVQCPSIASAGGVTCSIARLPLDAANPVAEKMVELMVARVDNGDPRGAGPVVFLQGGPGVGSVQNAPSFTGAQHDLILFDQRGTGLSTPKLSCPEVDELWSAQFTNDPVVRLGDDGAPIFAAYRRCSDRLVGEGIDLDAFNTAAVATDVELMRRLFDHEQWSIWGISYGTRVGLTIMRDHPAGVRAAVLDSVVPFEVDFFATIPENAFRSIDALDQACANDACAEDHGDFRDNLTALAAQLDAEPIIVPVTRPSGESFDFRVDGSELLSLVFIQLYSTRSLRALPRQISRADFGGIEEIVTGFVARRDPLRLDLSSGLYYSTWCREEFPFYDAETDDAFLAQVAPLFGNAVNDALGSQGIDQLCEIFDVAPSGFADDSPIDSDIPTLVFAGAFDPITPPAWSRQVAESLSAATFVELPDHGHGMTSPCPIGIRVNFLADPTQLVATACAIETGPPDFE